MIIVRLFFATLRLCFCLDDLDKSEIISQKNEIIVIIFCWVDILRNLNMVYYDQG